MTVEGLDSEGSSAALLDRILSAGYAVVRLSPAETRRLAGVIEEAGAFFAQDAGSKLRYAVPNRTTGYRPHAYAHAGDPDRPDLNDSFLYWPQPSRTPPNPLEIKSFLDAAEAYRQVAARITNDLVAALRTRYDYHGELPFEDASVLQVNSFTKPSEEPLLQQLHEDGTLITVIWANAPGLEGRLGERMHSFAFRPDEVVVMAGGVLTAMTGGAIAPLYHQVRNHRNPERKSVMYFVSPNADAEIQPFVVNDSNRDTDIRKLVLENPESYFGLSKDFVGQ